MICCFTYCILSIMYDKQNIVPCATAYIHYIIDRTLHTIHTIYYRIYHIQYTMCYFTSGTYHMPCTMNHILYTIWHIEHSNTTYSMLNGLSYAPYATLYTTYGMLMRCTACYVLYIVYHVLLCVIRGMQYCTCEMA